MSFVYLTFLPLQAQSKIPVLLLSVFTNSLIESLQEVLFGAVYSVYL